MGSKKAAELAQRLREAAAELMVTVAPIDDQHWRHVTEPGVWSISKEVEHAAEAAAYHQWIVRLTIGDKVPKRKPVLERAQMTSDLSAAEAVELIRQRADDGARLLEGLTDEQLDLTTQPPRARAPILAETIQGMLIDHLDSHRAEIEAKLRAFG